MGKPNIQRKIQNIMGKIVENVLKKGYPCIVDGCKESAINSHLLMINGILNNVAEDGHLIEVCTESPYSFSLQKNNEKKFKRIGVKQAFSLPIFCDLHDTTIFREIEQNEPIFTNYKHLALYTYRTICAEIRKKEQAHEICNRIISSKTLHNLMSEDFFENLKIHNLGYERGIYELKQYNQDLFDDIKGDTEHFCFVSLEIPKIDVYAAGVTNLYSSDLDISLDKLLPIFIFLSLPLQNSTRIIMGYHNDHCYPQMADYISRWQKTNDNDYGFLLTGILVHMETWGMSPSLYNRLLPERVKEYTELFNESMLWNSQLPIENLNLFE